MPRWGFRRLVFVDESGVNLSQTPAYGRAPGGNRVVDDVPCGSWETYSVIAGLRSTGVVAPMMIRGAMNSASMLFWVQRVLAPELRPEDIVVWDNLSIHEDPDVVAAITAAGARLEFLPPHSPELNPIEEAWSKVENYLGVAKARTVEALADGLGAALRAVSPADCLGWFGHAGYTL